MRISIAQTRPVKGNIYANIEAHKDLIEMAISKKVDVIFFPELSITGYEPELASDLSNHQDDPKFNDFQAISDRENISICVGFPTKGEGGILISMLIFQPNKAREVYSKQHLYPGEEKYFISGSNQVFIEHGNHKIAPAICYELSETKHSELAFQNGANIYVASVLNSVKGVDKDLNILSRIAKKYKMNTLMSNFTGQSGGHECAGKSSLWNINGELIGQLGDTVEGILVYDTETGELVEEKRNIR